MKRIAFLLLLLVLLGGITGVYFYFKRDLAKWDSATEYLPSNAEWAFEIKSTDALNQVANHWHESQGDSLFACALSEAASIIDWPFSDGSAWCAFADGRPVLVLPVGYGEPAELRVQQLQSKLTDVQSEYDAPYLILSRNGYVKPDAAASLAENSSFHCAYETVSHDLNLHAFFHQEDAWTALDEVSTLEGRWISGYACAPHLFLPSSNEPFRFPKIVSPAVLSFGAFQLGNAPSWLTYLDSTRNENVRNEMRSLRIQHEEKVNASLSEWLNNSATGEVGYIQHPAGKDSIFNGMIFFIGLKADSVDTRIWYTDSMSVGPIHASLAASTFVPTAEVFNGYVVKQNGFLFIANTSQALTSYLQYLSLSGNVEGKEFFKNLPQGGVITGYQGGNSMLDAFVGTGITWKLRHEIPFSQKLKVSYLVGNVIPVSTPKPNEDSVAVAPAPLPAQTTPEPAPAYKSKKVTNHQTGKQEEVRWTATKLSWYGPQGVRWAVNFSGNIVDVAQIDAFKNGKKQLLVLTRNRLECVDLNGKNVPGYPVVISSAVCTNLAVADYSNARDYRIVFGCENGTIYNYLATGKPTPGWNVASYKSDLPKQITYAPKGDVTFVVTTKSGKKIQLKRNGAQK